MKTIYKYILTPNKLKIETFKGAKFLTVQNQFEEICIWAEVDTNQPTEWRYFEVFGSGHQIPEDMGVDREYIGTVMLMTGTLVFHIYENIII